MNVADRMWARLLSGTNQPDFLRYKVVMEERRRTKALKQAESKEENVPEQISKSPPVSPSQNCPLTVRAFNPVSYVTGYQNLFFP